MYGWILHCLLSSNFFCLCLYFPIAHPAVRAGLGRGVDRHCQIGHPATAHGGVQLGILAQAAAMLSTGHLGTGALGNVVPRSWGWRPAENGDRRTSNMSDPQGREVNPILPKVPTQGCLWWGTAHQEYCPKPCCSWAGSHREQCTAQGSH